MADLMVATETFETRKNDGSPVIVHAGRTLVYDDDELAVRFPQHFKRSEQHTRPEVEDTSAAPGAKRGQTR